jgi:hypothetical protein
MSNGISELDKKVVGWKCGNRCALPECRKVLIIDGIGHDPESIIGEIAHIKGENPGSARYDPTMTYPERNCQQNLIILCRDHHKMVDDQINTYTVEKLLRQSTVNKVIDVTFSELVIVTKYLISQQPVSSDSYLIVPPKEKIRRNGLTSATERLVTMGMTQVKLVSNFIDKIPDIDFGDRLKQGFIAEYDTLKNIQFLAGDELFDALLNFASGSSQKFNERAAGLSVLVYLFEKCEVFEK